MYVMSFSPCQTPLLFPKLIHLQLCFKLMKSLSLFIFTVSSRTALGAFHQILSWLCVICHAVSKERVRRPVRSWWKLLRLVWKVPWKLHETKCSGSDNIFFFNWMCFFFNYYYYFTCYSIVPHANITVLSPRSSLFGSFGIPCIPRCIFCWTAPLQTLARGVGAAKFLDLPRLDQRCLTDGSNSIVKCKRSAESPQDVAPLWQKYFFS